MKKERGDYEREKYRDKFKICQCIFDKHFNILYYYTYKLSIMILLFYRQTETPWSIHFAVASIYLQY